MKTALLALVSLLALPAAGEEPASLGDLQQELRAVTRALFAEGDYVGALRAVGREDELREAWDRVLVLEGSRQDALRRLAGASDKPRPGPAVPPEAFARLLASEEWAAADPPRNDAGLFEAVHRRTGLVFVLLPGGEYVMGHEGEDDEKERCGVEPRRVSVAPFLLAKTECTQAAWAAGGGRVPFASAPGDRLPITSYGMTTYRSWAVKLGLRLPTEEEWEYACRAGGRTRWCYGDEPEKLDAFAWYRGSSGGALHEVAMLLPNAFGLHDMHGNASEFVAEPDDKVGLIFRGGDARTSERGCRSAYRFVGYRGGYVVRDSPTLGFRPAASLPGVPAAELRVDAAPRPGDIAPPGLGRVLLSVTAVAELRVVSATAERLAGEVVEVPFGSREGVPDRFDLVVAAGVSELAPELVRATAGEKLLLLLREESGRLVLATGNAWSIVAARSTMFLWTASLHKVPYDRRREMVLGTLALRERLKKLPWAERAGPLAQALAGGDPLAREFALDGYRLDRAGPPLAQVDEALLDLLLPREDALSTLAGAAAEALAAGNPGRFAAALADPARAERIALYFRALGPIRLREDREKIDAALAEVAKADDAAARYLALALLGRRADAAAVEVPPADRTRLGTWRHVPAWPPDRFLAWAEPAR